MKGRVWNEVNEKKRVSFEVRVKVTARVRKEAVIEVGENKLAVEVCAEAKLGEANRRVCELVAVHYKVETKNVHVVRGATSPNKTLRINR